VDTHGFRVFPATGSGKVRILWLSHRDIGHPQSGGAERTILEIGRRLVTAGNVVNWVSCGFPGAPRRWECQGMSVQRLGGPVATHLRVPRAIGSLRPEVIVGDLGHAVPWLTEWYSSTPGTAFFRHLHSRTLQGQVSSLLAQALSSVEKRYRFIFPSWPFVTESFQSVCDLGDLGIPAFRINRIPPGVDLEDFRLRVKRPEPTMVYFGGFRDYKRPWIPLEVFTRLSSQITGLRLVMIGDGPARVRVMASARSLRLKRVDFLGKLSRSKLAQVVAESWVNLHCSVSEGWGYSILEASAAGTPTAAFSVPGVAETIEPETNGILVPDGNVTALAAATGELIRQSPGWVVRCRGYAERFTWEKCAKSWQSHLLRL
jgi:glycosyltransferase involved in cell wall biosynthesis